MAIVAMNRVAMPVVAMGMVQLDLGLPALLTAKGSAT